MKKKTKQYSLRSNYVRYQDSMILECDKRQMNNQEVCETLNRQESVIEKLNEDSYKNLEHMKRQNFEIAMLRKQLRELKKGGMNNG
jgi:hypothetical protein